jgi:hypothetical protein
MPDRRSADAVVPSGAKHRPAGTTGTAPERPERSEDIVGADARSTVEIDPALHAEAAPQLEAAAEDREAGRRQRIAERAYQRAERRGFAPGQELDDWLAAEVAEDEPNDASAGRSRS